MTKCVNVKLYRIPECKLCDEVELNLKEFDISIYDCSRQTNKNAMIGLKRIFGKWFGYPIVVIQHEDIILLISGYYSELMKDIKKSIKEMGG